jgi:hypothetical protein
VEYPDRSLPKLNFDSFIFLGSWLNNSLKLEFQLPHFRDIERSVCGQSSGHPTPKLAFRPPKPAKGLGVIYRKALSCWEGLLLATESVQLSAGRKEFLLATESVQPSATKRDFSWPLRAYTLSNQQGFPPATESVQLSVSKSDSSWLLRVPTPSSQEQYLLAVESIHFQKPGGINGLSGANSQPPWVF